MTIGLLLVHRFTSDTNCGWAVWYWTDMSDAHGRKTNTRGHTTSLRCCFHRQAACVSQEVFDSACAQAFGNGSKQRIESVLIGCGHLFLTGHRRGVCPVLFWLTHPIGFLFKSYIMWSTMNLRGVTAIFLVMSVGMVQAQETCPNPFDGNADGVVGIGDLLDLLGLFGDSDSDGDGTWDSEDLCTDPEACNYDASPSESCAYLDFLGICNGGCTGDSDGDGICDDIDTCIGVFDECGVCNGPGPTEVNIVSITVLYDSIYAAQVDTWFVFEVGADTTFSYTCPPPPLPCGELMDFDGYGYATVQIGDQCWFAENLRSLHYDNGDAIPSGLTDSQWNSASFGATAVYGEDTGCNSESPDFDACDPAESLVAYGRLYNWYAVNDDRGLCPAGWHVPTHSEWSALTSHLGGTSTSGEALKSSTGWRGSGNGLNTSGFNGFPGGFRNSSSGGYFSLAGERGKWWASTPYSSLAYYRELKWTTNSVFSSYTSRKQGHSVRCIQD